MRSHGDNITGKSLSDNLKTAVRTFVYDGISKSLLFRYRRMGMKIGDGCRISRHAKLDLTNPKGVEIGDYTLVSFDTAVLTHDFIYRKHVTTRIGSFCFIGARAVVMPGVEIGDHVVVGAGSVVVSDIPPNCLVGGNPAKILRSDIVTGRWGIMEQSFVDADMAPSGVLANSRQGAEQA